MDRVMEKMVSNNQILTIKNLNKDLLPLKTHSKFRDDKKTIINR